MKFGKNKIFCRPMASLGQHLGADQKYPEIRGLLMQNDNILRQFVHFLKILIFWAKNGVKGQKWPEFRKS